MGQAFNCTFKLQLFASYMCQVSLFYRVRNCDGNKQKRRQQQIRNIGSQLASQLYNQMMPSLPGCLFKFIQKQPPQVFILLLYVQKTEKLFLEISHKIHKENTWAVCQSLFLNIFLKRDLNFANFFSHKTSCNLGDCQQMLLLFIDLSLTFLSQLPSQRQLPYTHCVCFTTQLFFMIAAAIFPVFYFLFLRLNLFPASYFFWFVLQNFILLLQWISYCLLSALFFHSFWVPSVD